MNLLIQKGRVIDPESGTDQVMDVLIENGKILRMEKDIDAEPEQVIDARGLWVTPGLIDLHVHFRDPGYTDKESIETGSRAALAGGFTTVCCMPNTKPVCHNGQIVRYIKEKATLVNILPVGSLTQDQAGKEPALYDEMVREGACGFSEDGKTLYDEGLFLQAMKFAKSLNVPILSHCEDLELAAGGVINAGEKAKELGVAGISNESEWRIIERDIAAAEETGAQLHICHVSTRQSLDVLRQAKAKGLKISAEAAPHHLFLCDEDIDRDWAGFKMNPPLRSREDMEAMLAGLEENIIDAIATDHAPHREDEKNTSFQKGANGIVGLETSLPLCITGLVMKNRLTPLQLIEKMSLNPARILGIAKGRLAVGADADITITDPEASYTIQGSGFQSKCKITPFEGRKVRGRVLYTIVAGEIRYKEDM